MNHTLKALSSDPNQACELLFIWSAEMQKYTPNIQSHLAHHLNTIGMDGISLKYVSKSNVSNHY